MNALDRLTQLDAKIPSTEFDSRSWQRGELGRFAPRPKTSAPSFAQRPTEEEVKQAALRGETLGKKARPYLIGAVGGAAAVLGVGAVRKVRKLSSLDRLTQLDAKLTKVTEFVESPYPFNNTPWAYAVDRGRQLGGATPGETAKRGGSVRSRQLAEKLGKLRFNAAPRTKNFEAVTEFARYPEEKPSLLGRIAKIGALGLGAYGLGSIARGAFGKGGFRAAGNAAKNAFVSGHGANMNSAKSAMDRVRDQLSKTSQGLPPVLPPKWKLGRNRFTPPVLS